MQRLLGHNHGSSPTFRWVLGVHVTALAALVLSGWFREWLKPDLEVIPVSMIEIPADTPVTETVQKATEQVDRTESENAPRLRTAEEIRRSALRPIENPPPVQRTTRPVQRPVEIDADSIAKRLRESVENVNVSIKLPSGAASTVTTDELQRYLGAISSVLYRAWRQPSAASVPENQRVAKVRLIVTDTGNIVNAALANSSGSAVMDQSVLAIFERQKTLPAPNRYGIDDSRFSVTIAFEIE
jgi:TonB family protein